MLDRIALLKTAHARGRDWTRWQQDLVGVTWQSLCLQVLCQKVREEKDIDDGTYTTVCAAQLANEFKRLEAGDNYSPTPRSAVCELIQVQFKKRIRDVKRIFTFYCAAGTGAGSAAEMSSQEFWKFVKDCKLQKNRKNMPSYRVDLIFQQCTIV